MAVRNTESHGSLFHGDDSRRTSPEGHGLETGIDVDLRDGDERECLLDRPPELQDSKSNAVLLAQGHKAAMQRSFSPLAALGLGFRYVGPVCSEAVRRPEGSVNRWR